MANNRMTCLAWQRPGLGQPTGREAKAGPLRSSCSDILLIRVAVLFRRITGHHPGRDTPALDGWHTPRPGRHGPLAAPGCGTRAPFNAQTDAGIRASPSSQSLTRKRANGHVWTNGPDGRQLEMLVGAATLDINNTEKLFYRWYIHNESDLHHREIVDTNMPSRAEKDKEDNQPQACVRGSFDTIRSCVVQPHGEDDSRKGPVGSTDRMILAFEEQHKEI
ncbi:hypothetical protein AAG570_004776 [Ranatra chinensis]|uniref:Uncharacterized protein n=1 Tax=Ranatra chinensis TaxID=642074 RepID=A0ABD0Y384_9HEMI